MASFITLLHGSCHASGSKDAGFLTILGIYQAQSPSVSWHVLFPLEQSSSRYVHDQLPHFVKISVKWGGY